MLAALVLASGCATIDEDELEVGSPAPKRLGGPVLSREPGWTEWRGTLRDAVVEGIDLPERLPEGEWPELWRLTVGAGLSGPVASGGVVFCHARRKDTEVVSAHDASTGRELWSRVNPPAPWGQPFPARKITAGPLATPTLRDGRLYTIGIYGLVQCLRAIDGDLLFSVSPESIDGEAAQYTYGHAASPLVRDGRLFVSLAGGGGGHLLALDAATGDVLWRALEEPVTYTSPVWARISGRDQVVVRTWERVVGLDPPTGRILWSHEAPARGLTRDCATPLVLEDMVYLSSNFHGTIAVRVSGGVEGRPWKADRIYRTGALAGGTASPVFFEGHLYGLHRKGFFVCVDARTGRRKWIARDFDEHLSIVSFGRRVLALDDEGSLALVELSPREYRPLARWRVGEYTWAQPGVDGGGLFIRDGDDLVRLAFSADSPKSRSR